MMPGSAILLLLIGGGVYALIILLIDWSNSSHDFFSLLFDGLGFHGKRRHRSRVKKWKRAIPILTEQRMEWETNSRGHRTMQRSIDMMAESLATHQEILEEMYGEAPSMKEVCRRVEERYRD